MLTSGWCGASEQSDVLAVMKQWSDVTMTLQKSETGWYITGWSWADG
jgi:hypothetical protein